MPSSEYNTEQREKKRRYYQANKMRILAARAKRYSENPERFRAEQRRRWINHPLTSEQKLAAKHRSAKHYQSHRKAILERTTLYRKNHPEIARRASVACNQRRRAAKCETVVDAKGISVWMSEIRSKPFVRCHWCGTKVTGKAIHFDHIIALSSGGTHTIGNLCASCPECNLTKKNRLIADWIAGGQTFLSL